MGGLIITAMAAIAGHVLILTHKLCPIVRRTAMSQFERAAPVSTPSVRIGLSGRVAVWAVR